MVLSQIREDLSRLPGAGGGMDIACGARKVNNAAICIDRKKGIKDAPTLSAVRPRDTRGPHVAVGHELPMGIMTPEDDVYHCHIVEHEDNDMMEPFR